MGLPQAAENSKKFLQKYLFKGQSLSKEEDELLENASWYDKFWIRFRRVNGLIIPAVTFHLFWWSLAFRYDLFQLFPQRYFMCITMIFGALIAGMTSEGGGAVAFPVMTLAFGITPNIARDFSLMIQSCGMTSAAFAIFWMNLRLEKHSLVLCSLGGALGLILGLEFLSDLVPPAVKKMFFVSVWASFACALFILNCRRKRKTFDVIPNMCLWKAATLSITGLVGGIFSALAGSGIDICSFSLLTLLFTVSEKVATPTSVVLMAVNTVIGFYWRQLMMEGIAQEAWDYFAVCVPVVVICAPLGSLISSYFHRLTLAVLIYVLEAVAFISGCVIVKPDLYLSLASAAMLLGGSLFFFIISRLGLWLVEKESMASRHDGPSGLTEIVLIMNGRHELKTDS